MQEYFKKFSKFWYEWYWPVVTRVGERKFYTYRDNSGILLDPIIYYFLNWSQRHEGMVGATVLWRLFLKTHLIKADFIFKYLTSLWTSISVIGSRYIALPVFLTCSKLSWQAFLLRQASAHFTKIGSLFELQLVDSIYQLLKFLVPI